MEPVPLPAPFGGVNETVPVIAVQSPNCENLLNFNVTREGVSLRHGDSKYASLTAGGKTAVQLVPYGSTKLWTVAYNSGANRIDIYDTDAGTVAYSSAASGTSFFYPLLFNNYLFLFAPNAPYLPGFVYDGATWGAIGYTGSGFAPSGGNVYNGRSYIIQSAAPEYWYSGIEAISGTVTKVDLASIVEEKCTLSIIASFTLSDSQQTQRIQSFVFSNGEVLFYQGSYPDSTSWSIVGRAQIGQPLNVQSFLSYQGDALIFCDTGVISLRDLFLRGSEAAASLSVNTKMQDTWQDLVQAARITFNVPSGPLALGVPGFIQGAWDRKTDRLIIQFPFFLDSAGDVQYGNFQFVFDTILQSWFFHRSFGAGTQQLTSIAVYKNKVLTCATGSTKLMVYEKEGATGFTDRDVADTTDVGYDFEIKTAPVANGRAYVQRATGLDVIIESDLDDVTNYQLVRDLGVETSTAQKVSFGSGLQKPFVNMGIEGSYIQIKVSGTTTSGKTVGLTIYGMNLWIERGSSPR